jgi:hypothetical protein
VEDVHPGYIHYNTNKIPVGDKLCQPTKRTIYMKVCECSSDITNFHVLILNFVIFILVTVTVTNP